MKNVILALLGVATFCTMAILGKASTEPDVLHIERSIVIEAPAATVFPFANDYENWGAWDPWRAKDPDQKTTLSETTAGVGAWTAWEGDENVGKGKMSITESVANEKVVQDLDFIEPFESHAVATLAMVETDGKTHVTWSFDSEQDLMAKLAGMFMNMDEMLGPDFKQGLTNLKRAAEAVAAEAAAAEEAETERLRLEEEAAAAKRADGAEATP